MPSTTKTVRVISMPKSLNGTLAESTMEQRMGEGRALGSVPEADLNGSRDHLSRRMSFPSQYPTGITYASQDKLPKLPIPELESTIKKYLAALKPMQTAREHAETIAATEEFLKGEGPDLQERLKKYAVGRTSYIEQFWYDSYLNYDNPVVLNLNPFFLLEDDPTPARNNQVTRAASLVVSALSFVRAVRKEELKPDSVKGTPLCMHQYSRLFGTARVPTDNGCQIVQDPESTHIVVLCHGQFYWFDVMDGNSDLIMTEKDISQNLQTIVDDAQQTPIQDAAKGALGVLSTENRKVWSSLRDVLTREEGSNNWDCLGIVDSALFILCLDYTEPSNAADLCQNMLCGTSEVERGVQTGTCTNRWYDKLQIIVCKNGSAGINFEHTGVDGHTVLRFASDVYTDTILRYAHSINGQAPSMWASTSPDPAKRDKESLQDLSITPHKLEWDMIPELSIALRFAETRLADLINQNEFETLDFTAYGKNFITSQGFSPDAFIQMAFQAAYYGLYGRVECIYEPAMTKAFLHGRTEAIRAVTSESLDFVQTFWSDGPAEQKIEVLRNACKKHSAVTRECSKGEGCDRHLYALFSVWQRLVEEADGESAVSTTYTNSIPYDTNSERAMSSVVGSPGRDSACMSDGEEKVEEKADDKSEMANNFTTEDVITTSNNRSEENGSSLRRESNSSGRSTPSRQHAMPQIFADGGWDKLNTTIISTSNCGNPSLRQFGFGPTSGEGFGIGYIIKNDSIAICASSKHRQTKRFVHALESYLLEVRRILRTIPKEVPAAKAPKTPAPPAARPRLQHRVKSRGRMIKGDGLAPLTLAHDESAAQSDDEGLGGYGFFDAGMLLQALKAREEAQETASADGKGSEHGSTASRRRAIGKKLRLSEY